jgi:hypothetical protein
LTYLNDITYRIVQLLAAPGQFKDMARRQSRGYEGHDVAFDGDTGLWERKC